MAVEATDAGPAGFEEKWRAAQPEFGLGLAFVPATARAARSAFACIVFELEQAAFATDGAEAAAAKLAWWGEEFGRMSRQQAQHPLARVLQDWPATAAVTPAAWYAVLAGAFAQREPEPCGDADALLAGYAALYEPVAGIEAALFPGSGAGDTTRARALPRAVRECAALPDVLREGRLPLPLDLLARHRLSRSDLDARKPARTAALQEWFAELARRLAALRPAGPVQAAATSTMAWRARRAARAGEPLAALHDLLERLPMRAALAAWRAARGSGG